MAEFDPDALAKKLFLLTMGGVALSLMFTLYLVSL